MDFSTPFEATPVETHDAVIAERERHPKSSRASSRTPRVLACVLCQQRKVKCDRKFPCGNCIKARVQCISSIPAPPRRRQKKTQSGLEDLLAKVKRYEALLKKYGEDLDPNHQKRKEIDDPSPHDETDSAEDGIRNDTQPDQTDSENELPDIGGLLIDACPPNTNLTEKHPTGVQIFRLWQTFIDNVNPIVKFIHIPTMQQSVLEASADLGSVSKPMEALLFGIYSASVNSLTNAECESLLGEQKIRALARLHSASLRALQRVQFLKTESMLVLQAFILLLISARSYYDIKTQWVLSGVSVIFFCFLNPPLRQL